MGLRCLCCCFFLFSTILSFSQKLFEDKINVRAGEGVDNRDAIIYLPAHYSKDKAYPLVLFAHGMGEAGNNIKKLYHQGLPKVLKQGYRPPFDFIMVAVQRNSFSIMPEWLPGILNDCHKRWKIDDSRIYLTGLSAGGWSNYGSQLNISPAFAKKFAAIVINSGAAQNANHKNFDWWKESKTPLWAIVGAADRSFVYQNTVMVNEINKRVPGLATLTLRPGVGHGGWSDVYNGKVKLNGKNMWEWLYQFKRGTSGITKPPVTSKPPVEQIPPPNSDSTVSSNSDRNIKVNFYTGPTDVTNNSWNDWNLHTIEEDNLAQKLRYDDGTATNITATLSNSRGVVDNGADYEGGMAPAGVLRYASYSIKSRTLTFAGLSKAKTYKLYLYASRRNRSGYSTIYKVNRNKQVITTNNNHTNKAFFDNLKPDANGRIQVLIESGNQFNYLNGFTLIEEAQSGK